jgi:hypothetical protein
VISQDLVRNREVILTNHVTLIILSGFLLGDVALDPQEDRHAILDSMLGWVKPTQEKETLPIVDLMA